MLEQLRAALGERGGDRGRVRARSGLYWHGRGRAYDLATPGHSVSNSVLLLVADLLLAVICGRLSVVRWPEVRRYRADRAARRA